MKISGIKRVFSGAPWEKSVGYCRAVRFGDQVSVSGTAPVARDGSVHAPGDAYEQAKRCFEIIEQSLKEVDASLDGIIRTRMYVTDITLWKKFGRAHREFFGEHPPATTMVEVQSLIDSEMLIEVEAEAIIRSE